MLTAPKPLLAICAIWLATSALALILRFEVLGLMKFLVMGMMFYQMLLGSKVSAYCVAIVFLMYGIVSIFVTYIFFVKVDIKQISIAIKREYLLLGALSLFCLASSVYIVISNRVKGYFASLHNSKGLQNADIEN